MRIVRLSVSAQRVGVMDHGSDGTDVTGDGVMGYVFPIIQIIIRHRHHMIN